MHEGNVQPLSPSSFDALCSVQTQTLIRVVIFAISLPLRLKRSVRLDVAFRVFAMAIRYRHGVYYYCEQPA